MEKRCVERSGSGCINCKLTRSWTHLKCAKNKWERPFVRITQWDYYWMDGKKMIAPRYRKMFKIAEECQYYEGGD